MRVLTLDIETTLIPEVEKVGAVDTIHVCVAQLNGYPYWPEEDQLVCPTKEGSGILQEKIDEAEVVVGHNLMSFDRPVLKRVWGVDIPEEKCWDTKLVGNIWLPDTKELDAKLVKKGLLKGPDLKLPHSLRTWAKRVGLPNQKGEYTGGFEAFNEEMLKYCAQDVKTCYDLYLRERSWGLPEAVLRSEHAFASYLMDQMLCGVAFDSAAASDLLLKLRSEHGALAAKLVALVPPRLEQLKTKVKEHPFNPASRPQVAAFLQSKGWVPEVFTDAGSPKLDDTILEKLVKDIPEAGPLARYFMLEKRIGQLADGKSALMRFDSHGRIFGSMSSIGTVTHRCSHAWPNLGQVPSEKSEFGHEFRALFMADPGWDLVGVDASGLQLRCLAHYLARYDGGEYARIVLEGDIHTENQKAAGLATRDMAKTFIYGWLFGAGDAKIGKIVGGTAADGARLKAKFIAKFPAMGQLKKDLERALATRGHLLALDGRPLRIRHKHAMLNSLLMSCEAVLVKKATILCRDSLRERGLVLLQDWKPVLHVHDEWQITSRPEASPLVAEIAAGSIRRSGEHFAFRCRLDGKAKIGKTWADTH